MKNTLPALLLAALPLATAQAQVNSTGQQEKYKLQVARCTDKVQVDGDLAEPIWQKTEPATGFWLKWPRDGAPAPEQTEVRCASDGSWLYIAVTAFDSTPQYVVQSLKRDVGYWDSDGFAVVLDPTNTANNGYFFGVSANGVQTEALLASGSDDMDRNWDNTWFVEAKNYPDRWTAEYAIPLRILRFEEGKGTWGVNFIRNDLSNGLYSTWAQIPFQFDAIDMGWTGAMQWEEAPRRSKGNYNIIPYVNAAASRDFEAAEPWKFKPNAGLDAKIGIGAGLNLDVTLNPDFSQIEIDEQVVNLTRFNIQLPEKRTFFLENGDLFGSFGIPPIRPFFSRRIGLDEDGIPLPILGGLRLTGNLGADTRIGAMTMQTGAQNGEPSRNFSALALRQRLFGRSTLNGYFLDREEFNKAELLKGRFSRNAGLEFNFTSTDGKWSSWISHHRSFKPNIRDKNWWGNSGFAYSVRKFFWLTDITHMGENYYADMGFEQRIENYDVVRDTSIRIGYNFVFNTFNYQIFPKNTEKSRLNFIEFGGEIFTVLNPGGTLNESSNDFYAEANFKNTSSLSIGFRPNWANVPVPFKFDGEEDLNLCPALPAGEYQFGSARLNWSSDYRKAFFYSVSANWGQFYNGHQTGFRVEANWRIRTIANVQLVAAYNLLDFPAPYCDARLFNITPRVEVFFAKNIWWTTFLQYNTQADNFNVNSRLQWRFRPMSDFFLVYTDNYAVQQWGPRNRSLVAKASYWF
jgi:hypothetical protein